MTNDSLTNPFGPLAKVEIFGHPYHGLVVNGELTLPNSEVIDYRNPSNPNAFAIQLDGVPAVSRTTEQALEDAERGFQWLSKVVLSGSTRNQGSSVVGTQLYGTADESLGVGASPTFWLWRDSLGVVWRFSLGSVTDTTLQIKTKKFGRFGEPAAAETTSTISHAIDNGEFPLDLAGEPLELIDVNSNGSKAILAVLSSDAVGHIGFIKGSISASSDIDFFSGGPVLAPVGFVLIEITEGETEPEVALTTLRNYSQTLGTITVDAPNYNGYALLPGADDQKNGTLTFSTDVVIEGRILSMYFDGPSIKEVTVSYHHNSGEAVCIWTWPNAIPVSYSGTDYTMSMKLTLPTSRTRSIDLKFDGVVVESISQTVNTALYTESTETDGEFFSLIIYKGGTTDSYYEVQLIKGSQGPPPVPANYVGIAKDTLPRLGIISYTTKLFGTFWVENPPLEWVWSDAHSVYGGTSSAPPPNTSWSGTTMTSNLWNRSLDPITLAISDQYDVPVCYV